MKPTLGLTGLTFNAMALIAPGAFLWLTYEEQCLYGAPLAGSSMWFGFLMALLLCFATAMSYAELTKLYPGAGSSYFYAEQAFLSKSKAFKFARVMKFFVGWASHLYYWVYPGLMVGVTAIFISYISGVVFPNTFSSTYNSPLEMIIVCVGFRHRRVLHRLPRGERLDGGEYRDEYHPDRRVAGVFLHGRRLSHEPQGRRRRHPLVQRHRR